jgi:hypothetical protein
MDEIRLRRVKYFALRNVKYFASQNVKVAFCPRQKAFIKPKVVEAEASTSFFLNVCRKANVSLAVGEYHCADGAISLTRRVNITVKTPTAFLLKQLVDAHVEKLRYLRYKRDIGRVRFRFPLRDRLSRYAERFRKLHLRDPSLTPQAFYVFSDIDHLKSFLENATLVNLLYWHPYLCFSDFLLRFGKKIFIFYKFTVIRNSPENKSDASAQG